MGKEMNEETKPKQNLYTELFTSSSKMFKKLHLEDIVYFCLFLLTSDGEGVSKKHAKNEVTHLPVVQMLQHMATMLLYDLLKRFNKYYSYRFLESLFLCSSPY